MCCVDVNALLVTFDSPMNISSPDLYSSKCSTKDFVDIDLVEDSNCGCTGEYAHSIFAYLREAEVSFIIVKSLGYDFMSQVPFLMCQELCDIDFAHDNILT